jgi:hypothetical protein
MKGVSGKSSRIRHSCHVSHLKQFTPFVTNEKTPHTSEDIKHQSSPANTVKPGILQL